MVSRITCIYSISSIVGVDGVDTTTSHTEDVDDKFTLQSLQDDSMTFVGFKEEYNQIVEKLLQGGNKLSALYSRHGWWWENNNC